MQIALSSGQSIVTELDWQTNTDIIWELPPGCVIQYWSRCNSIDSVQNRFEFESDSVLTGATSERSDRFHRTEILENPALRQDLGSTATPKIPAIALPTYSAVTAAITLPRGCTQVVPGSSWGMFTIACTIPIALFVGLWMYRIRKGRVVEASLIGGVLDARRPSSRATGFPARRSNGSSRSPASRPSARCASTASSPRCCRCGCCSARATTSPAS